MRHPCFHSAIVYNSDVVSFGGKYTKCFHSGLDFFTLPHVYLPESNPRTMLATLMSKQKELNFQAPILLFENQNHKIYWLGMAVPDAFRTNIYLIQHGDEAIVVDPGNKSFFGELFKRIHSLSATIKIVGGIFCHQDPDVAGSIVDWVEQDKNFKVISSKRTNVLLPHYGIKEYQFHDATEENEHQFSFSDGYQLKFIDAHFLHFPGAIATYDPMSKFLFSGDVWAAIDIDFNFIADDFEHHELKMNLFHLDYMCSHVATQGFAHVLSEYEIDGILPQHGAIIPQQHVSAAIDYLQTLRCGLDLIYPDIP